MKRPEAYWRDVVRCYVEGTDVPSADIHGDGRTLETGEATHTLEFLDFLSDAPDDDTHLLHEKSRERRIENVFFNRLLHDEIENIDSEVREHDLPYAWLKGGAFLRNDTYPKGVRRLSDLDLLLRKQDLGIWHDALTKLGYGTHRDPEWIRSSSFSDSVSSTFYTREQNGKTILIDVHWHLVDYPARRAAGRWDFEMEPVFRAIEDRSLAPEHRILYLLDHAFSHEFRFWKFVTDLHHVLENHSLDRSFLKEEADRTHFGDTLQLGMSFLKLFFDGTLPDHFREPLGEYVPEKRGAFEEKALRGELPKSVFLRQSFRWLKSCRQRLVFLTNIVFPPVSAVPRISSDSSFLEVLRLYGRRMRRVLRRGPAIWGINSF